MEKYKLWEQWNHWQENYHWVDLSHPVSATTPHWVGWPALKVEEKMNLDASIFAAHSYTTVGQYGTHVDAPTHMVKGGRSLDEIEIKEMVMPLCVINKEEACKQNADYAISVADIEEWEKEYGIIPKQAMVVFQSGWSKLPAEMMDNLDSEGNRHFPGWSLEAVQFLVQQRGVGAIGHETSDTDTPITSSKTNYEVEHYILSQDRIQVEMLRNLDSCPPKGALLFCMFPAIVKATGFPVRCVALCPNK